VSAVGLLDCWISYVGLLDCWISHVGLLDCWISQLLVQHQPAGALGPLSISSTAQTAASEAASCNGDGPHAHSLLAKQLHPWQVLRITLSFNTRELLSGIISSELRQTFYNN
jgi:hypothetical protein